MQHDESSKYARLACKARNQHLDLPFHRSFRHAVQIHALPIWLKSSHDSTYVPSTPVVTTAPLLKAFLFRITDLRRSFLGRSQRKLQSLMSQHHTSGPLLPLQQRLLIPTHPRSPLSHGVTPVRQGILFCRTHLRKRMRTPIWDKDTVPTKASTRFRRDNAAVTLPRK